MLKASCFSWKRTLAAIVVSLLTLFLTPLILAHYCDAGSLIFECILSASLCLIAYLYVLYGQIPKRRLLLLITWLLAVFGITQLYFMWIHGPLSPWPASY
jgi:hypothetical protein